MRPENEPASARSAAEPAGGLSTSAAAARSGYSVQQVRDLEAAGVIPPATRAANGYRRFSSVHVRALAAYRDLARAVGAGEARATMSAIGSLPPDEGAARVAALHAGLQRAREQTSQARAALVAISEEAQSDAPPRPDDTLTITELAGALGVRTSTLRFWESVGLVRPERITTVAGTARRYSVVAVREARITGALRSAGHRVPDVRAALGAVRELADVADSLAALDARRDAIAQQMLALLRAGPVLAEMIERADPHAGPGDGAW